MWRFSHIAGSVAPVAIVVARIEEARRREPQMFDVGQVVMSMMLAAADLGIGSGHSVVEDEQLARRLLGYPDDRLCAHLVPLGYPAGRPLSPLQQPNRRPFGDVVHRNRRYHAPACGTVLTGALAALDGPSHDEARPFGTRRKQRLAPERWPRKRQRGPVGLTRYGFLAAAAGGSERSPARLRAQRLAQNFHQGGLAGAGGGAGDSGLFSGGGSGAPLVGVSGDMGAILERLV